MQVFDSIRHTMLVRRVAVLCVVFALVALSCRPFLAQAQAGATRGDRSGEFGTSVTVVPSAEGKMPAVRFDWVVPAGTQLIPGDNVTISLPDWLEPVRMVQQDQPNVRCISTQASTAVTCTFIDVSTPSADILGSVEVPVAVKNANDSAPVRWGGRVFDLRKELAANHLNQAIPTIPPVDIVEAAHQQPNGRWDVIASARQSRSGRIVVESSKADQGFVEVRRRDAGAAYDRGTWEDAASTRCQPGGDLHAQQLGCAQRVFLADSTGEMYFAGAAGERVSVWSLAGALTVVIDNPVRDAAYRVQFASSLPDPVIYVNGVVVSAPAVSSVHPTASTGSAAISQVRRGAWYHSLLAAVQLIPWAFDVLVPHHESTEPSIKVTPVTSSELTASLADTDIATSTETVDRSYAANTGASIVGLVLLSLLVILGGTAFVLRGRSTKGELLAK